MGVGALHHAFFWAHLVTVAFTSTTAMASKKKLSDYFALCAVINERPEVISEWVDYHLALGIQKIYLMLPDYPESDAVVAGLSPHVAAGLVEVYPLPRVNPRTVNLLQVKLYDACLSSVRDKHQFIGFWDADEFLVPLDPGVRFPDFLRSFEDVGGLAVSWRAVGPSGHVTRPSGGTLSSFLLCTPWDFVENSEIKSIVNTRYALYPTTDPHSFVYSEGRHAVDYAGRQVSSTRNPYVSSDWMQQGRIPQLALYHYVTKSEDQFVDKMRRGSAMGNRKDEMYFRKIAQAAVVPCEEARDVCVRLGLRECGDTTAGARKRAGK